MKLQHACPLSSVTSQGRAYYNDNCAQQCDVCMQYSPSCIFNQVIKCFSLLSTMQNLAACLLEKNRTLRCRLIARYPSATLSTLLRAGSKPHKRRSLFIRLSFDPPNFLLHASMHLLSHQVSAKLFLCLEPEWLRQSVRLLIFRPQILKSDDPVLDVVDQVVDTPRKMHGTPVSACLLGRQLSSPM